jgi:23S rRNA (cytidine1920-2'-O)/16S rRNA (cytidine1409-2'-O)-methyltransferase
VLELIQKKRLDCLIFDRGLAESREKAKAVIMAGQVYVEGQKQDKPGTSFPEEVQIEVRGNRLPYVSRGGLKLEKALALFPIDLNGKVVMDIGASTGGFTDCMLQSGAKKVYSVDVGYGQLAWKLRTDPRVVSLERTNVRYLTKEQVPEPIEFFSVDVSFISLRLVLPVARRFLSENGQAVCLIKPQFEAGRENVGKKGVVREKKVHVQVIRRIVDFVQKNGFSVLGLTYSPVKGPEGNIEYLLYLRRSDHPTVAALDIQTLVEESHRQLNGGETD